MAVPKRRKSHSRTRQGRAHHRLSRPALVYCTKCGASTLPHRVCPSCGHYQGREIVEQEGS